MTVSDIQAGGLSGYADYGDLIRNEVLRFSGPEEKYRLALRKAELDGLLDALSQLALLRSQKEKLVAFVEAFDRLVDGIYEAGEDGGDLAGDPNWAPVMIARIAASEVGAV